LDIASPVVAESEVQIREVGEEEDDTSYGCSNMGCKFRGKT
jgi:hypothetical protein